MKFVTIRDLRANTGRLRKDLDEGREIVLTANGRPFALMTPVEPDTVEEELLAIRRARAQAALSRIRAKAKAAGLDRTRAADVDAVIAKVRRERRASE
jgi:antitoxin (DNA-binding transcriptional repressor) of toxin-antitoxin stability system